MHLTRLISPRRTAQTTPKPDSLAKTTARSRARRALSVGSYNLFAWLLLAIYLLPVAFMVVTAFKSTDQLLDGKAPWYPARIKTYPYQGQAAELIQVPMDGGLKTLALVTARHPVQPVRRPAGAFRRVDRVAGRLPKIESGL